MGPHKIREREIGVSLSEEKRTSLIQVGNTLSGEIVITHQIAAVVFSLQSHTEKFGVKSVCIDLQSEKFQIFLEEVYPCIDVTGTVVTMHHGNRHT